MFKTTLIGTHHKTGSVWMNRWFSSYASTIGIPFVSLNRDNQDRQFLNLRSSRVVYFQDHSVFSKNFCDARGLRLIRDPRDVIISGARYHVRSDEPWLLKRRLRFGGLNYREKINSCSSFQDKLRFEMRNAGKRTIQDMLEFSDSRFLTIKYEDLFLDFNVFKKVELIAEHLNIEGEEKEALITTYVNSHLKSQTYIDGHVSSGEVEQWRDVFDGSLLKEFNARFPKALAKLGYSN